LGDLGVDGRIILKWIVEVRYEYMDWIADTGGGAV
jgi:hypothetical protein